MKHEKYKELLHLNVLGELSETEGLELKNHLFECDECNKEYAQIKKFYNVISTERQTPLNHQDLLNSRKRLFNIISSEVQKPTFSEKLQQLLVPVFIKKYSLAFGSLALVLLGLFIGFVISNNINTPPKLLTENIIDLDKIKNGEIKINKVNLPEIFSDNDEFEFRLSGSKPNKYKGTLNDVVVQKLLAWVLKETDNPGFKIKTSNKVANLITDNFLPDDKIKEAFIHSLKTDKNPGVRKSALKALINFPYDNKIRDVLLFTLDNDINASIRIDAINALLAAKVGAFPLDNKIRSKLETGITKEGNELIKYKTTKLLIGGR